MQQEHPASEVRRLFELYILLYNSKQFFRLCTQSNLSESVEQLLQCVVEGGVKKECPSIQNDEQLQQDGTSNEESPKNITDRLEKLCSAFDIIQKYLEEQSGGSLKQDAQNSQISSDPSN